MSDQCPRCGKSGQHLCVTAVEGTTYGGGLQPTGCTGPFTDARDCPVCGPKMPPDPRDAEIAHLKAENERLTRELAEQRAELAGSLSVLFQSIPACYDTPADHYREMVRRTMESRDALKHQLRAAEQHESTLREKLTPLVNRCGELFSDIRGDWSDPRTECREGWAVCDQMRALLAPETTPKGSALTLPDQEKE